MNNHAELVQLLFNRIQEILKIPDITLRIMKRRGEKSNKRYILGYINLKTKVITLDIYTPKTLKPKSLNSLIRTLAHEIAHIQKPPYRQLYKGKIINRQHYPAFYKQIEKNIAKIKKDPSLRLHFTN